MRGGLEPTTMIGKRFEVSDLIPPTFKTQLCVFPKVNCFNSINPLFTTLWYTLLHHHVCFYEQNSYRELKLKKNYNHIYPSLFFSLILKVNKKLIIEITDGKTSRLLLNMKLNKTKKLKYTYCLSHNFPAFIETKAF
jgi:hypothetical protein